MRVPLIFLLLSVLTLFSCGEGNLFMGNLFESVDIPFIPIELDQASSDQLVDLAADLGEHFYEAIDTRSEFDAVTSTLNDTILDPNSSDSEKQDAALVLANVYLYDSGVNDSLNQATQDVSGAQELDLSDPVALGDFMFGAEATAEEISPQLLGMFSTYAALNAYGETLETSPPPEGADTDLLAMQAITAAVMTAILDSTATSQSVTIEEAAVLAAAYLAEPTLNPCPWNSTVLDFMNYSGVEESVMEASLATNFDAGIANVIVGSTVSELLRQ